MILLVYPSALLPHSFFGLIICVLTLPVQPDVNVLSWTDYVCLTLPDLLCYGDFHTVIAIYHCLFNKSSANE